MARRAGTGCDRGIEAVDVDGQVIAEPFRDTRQNAIAAKPTDISDGEDIGARRAGRIVIGLVRRRDVADPELRKACHMRHFGGAPKRITVAVLDAMALIDEIKVCVDVDDMNWILTGEGADARNMHAVVAAKHHRQRTSPQDVANTGLDVVMARDGVRMDDIGIADINDDGIVNGIDVTIVLSSWGLSDVPADLTGDGIVNGADLTILLASWGMCL